MNDKEVPKTDKDQDFTSSEWKFCPICGNKLPNIEKLKFCTVCGTDVQHIKDFKSLRPKYNSNPYKSPTQYSQYEMPPIYYGIELISDGNLMDTKDHKLWGTTASIGLPVVALLIMNGLVGGFLTLVLLLSNDYTPALDLISNSYLLSLVSVFELVFIIFPVLYVRKFLKNPTLKNRLILLGFTTRNYDRKRIFKEILIGLGFALIGVIIVTFASIAIELVVEQLFGVTVIHDSTGLTGEVIPTDLSGLIVFSIVVILVIGTSEEVLFRGFMQKGLTRSLGERWGLITSAIIFSMIHLITVFLIALESPYLFLITFLLSFTPYFAISLMMGWLYRWRNENLIAVIITHGVYDVLAIVMTYLIYGVF
ncbi:MAG: CPBP family glutamic-type intramembrane protease [Promethearchaeota archaeon]|jgi:membrane protease YdiL (CAAX protease family)